MFQLVSNHNNNHNVTQDIFLLAFVIAILVKTIQKCYHKEASIIQSILSLKHSNIYKRIYFSKITK